MSIVVVTGGFDPLHIGHIRHFESAKRLGDILIVVLNTDKYLMKKKGYVFMPFEERKEIIESIGCVDMVARCIDTDQFQNKTLEALSRFFPGFIFAKGGDRTEEHMPESEIEICKQCGIKIVYGIGGGKIKSSQELVKNANEVSRLRKNTDNK